jgi:hypothetical protein
MTELLFSICTYESIYDSIDGVKANAKQRTGSLLRIKYDKHHQEYLLLFKLL